MANEIIEVKNEIKSELSLTGGDIQRVADHLKVVKDAVKNIMNEGINSDYAIIPGTPKKSLLKPGAEKLMRLFGLGVRFQKVSDECQFDLVENFAMFTYVAEVYHLKTGLTIAQCEATANSQEKKYATKTVWTNNVKTTVPMPVADILNTLKKMAQKRAMVGAVIIAVGASDYFSQDEDEISAQQPERKQAEKVSQDRFNGGDDAGSYVMKVGPRKGKTLNELGIEQVKKDLNYWASRATDGPAMEFVNKAREFTRGAA
ncbi:MAG: hypothetical protein CME63_01655 [Halobacteriovoraceae bacterium]|nr:hypothetical protein [Halobacteriovoraceae bacterium]|tara:strand:+ start:1850 stop:2626 length:777 start_codon:yes stop_codon:yes gene_type:complete